MVLASFLQHPLLGGALRQKTAQTACWGGNPAPRCVKTKKAGSPKPKGFRQRFGYFAAEGKVTRVGTRNIPLEHKKSAAIGE